MRLDDVGVAPAARPRCGLTSMVFAFASCAVALLSASGAGLSSMTVGPLHFDSHATPLGRAVDGDGHVPVTFAGSWFESGACELYVDGVLSGSSSGAVQTNLLEGAEGTWRTYHVTLKSAEGELTKIITIYPYAGYACPVHSLAARADFLDARPAGTVRKVRFDETLPVTWSGAWTNEADRAVVRLYSGTDTNGTFVAELVNAEGRGEGEYTLSPAVAQLSPGLYTLTHFDGVDTLFAYLKVCCGMIMIVK